MIEFTLDEMASWKAMRDMLDWALAGMPWRGSDVDVTRSLLWY